MNLLLKGNLETLGFFIDQMSLDMEDFTILDLTDKQKFFCQIKQLDSQLDDSTYVITFNNAGVFFNVNGQNYWEKKQVKLYNILVDHPIFFYKEIKSLPFIKIICIDQYHEEFVKKHFPDHEVHFLPHGGAKVPDTMIRDWTKRDIDVLYVGRKYQNPFTSDETNWDDYTYSPLRGMYDLLCQYPQFTVETMLEICEEEIGNFISGNRLAVMRDIYAVVGNGVRAYYQEKVIRELARHGITIDIYGNDWEKLKEDHPDHIHLHGFVSSQRCIEEMCRSKIVLNILPWFKNGAHERVYNAMYAGALCVSDTSEYLAKYFYHGKDIILFDLLQLDKLTNLVDELLSKPNVSEDIIKNQFAKVQHSSWRDRFDNIQRGSFRPGIDFV